MNVFWKYIDGSGYHNSMLKNENVLSQKIISRDEKS